MKMLTLLRHAKSGWDDPDLRDFDRPLNAKGRRAAGIVGANLRAMGLAFDHIVASPAVRVTQTLAEVERRYGSTLAPVWDKRLYLAPTATLMEIIQDLPAKVGHALIAGHNPGLEDLVLLLVAEGGDDALRGTVEEKFPTASIAVMTFDIDDWTAVRPAGATLSRFVRPRDLDPALGPDAE